MILSSLDDKTSGSREEDENVKSLRQRQRQTTDISIKKANLSYLGI